MYIKLRNCSQHLKHCLTSQIIYERNLKKNYRDVKIHNEEYIIIRIQWIASRSRAWRGKKFRGDCEIYRELICYPGSRPTFVVNCWNARRLQTESAQKNRVSSSLLAVGASLLALVAPRI